MIMDYIPAIAGKVSGQKARRTIQELMEFHRIPVSEDYRKAAVFCREKLEGDVYKRQLFRGAALNQRVC